jgi:hypothetical protein
MSVKELQSMSESLKEELAQRLGDIEEKLAQGEELMKKYKELQNGTIG